MNIPILIVIVIFLLLVYINWINSDRRFRARAESLTRRSAGGNDLPAKEALTELRRIQVPTVQDTFNTVQILRYNFDVTPNDIYMGHLLDTVLNGAVYLEPNADFIVNRLMDITYVPPITKEKIIENRIQSAINSSPNKKETIITALTNTVQHTDDLQNVHDTAVNRELNKTLSELKKSYTGLNHVQDAVEFAKIKYTGKELDTILTLLYSLETYNIITFNDSELNIFNYVWDRTNHSQNTSNAGCMKEAIINAVRDFVENGNKVCPNGRCARLLTAFVGLDFNKELGNVMTMEAHRNEIFETVRKLIDYEILMASKCDDEKLRNLASNYTGNIDVKIDENTEKEFKESIRKKIENIIDSDKTFTDIERIELKRECSIYTLL